MNHSYDKSTDQFGICLWPGSRLPYTIGEEKSFGFIRKMTELPQKWEISWFSRHWWPFYLKVHRDDHYGIEQVPTSGIFGEFLFDIFLAHLLTRDLEKLKLPMYLITISVSLLNEALKMTNFNICSINILLHNGQP